MSCCLLVDVHQVDNAVSTIYREHRCVLKVFDFKYSQGLRTQYNCGTFTPECAAELNQLTTDDEYLNPMYWLEKNVDVKKSKSTFLADGLQEGDIGPTVSRLELACFELDEICNAQSQDPHFPSLSLTPAEKEAFLFTLMQKDYAHQRKCFDAIDGLEGFPSFIASGFIVRECEEATPAPQLCHYPVIMMSFIEDAITLQPLYSAKRNGHPAPDATDVERAIIQDIQSFSDEQWHTLYCQAHTVIYKLWLQGLQYDDLRLANFMIARDKTDSKKFRIVLVDMGGLKVLNQEYIELYSKDRGRRRYLESRPEPLVRQYEDNTIHQQRAIEELEGELQSIMESIVPSSYINSQELSFRGVSTRRFRAFGRGLQQDCNTTVMRFLFETLFASLAGSRFGDDAATVAAILRHATQILDYEYCRSFIFTLWGYRAFLRIALLVCPMDDRGHSNERLRQKSALLLHALRQRPGGSVPFTIKQIQQWAQASNLWDDAPWSDPNVQSTRLLSLLDGRHEKLQNEEFTDSLGRTVAIGDQLLGAGKDILWSEDDIARSRQLETKDHIRRRQHEKLPVMPEFSNAPYTLHAR